VQASALVQEQVLVLVQEQALVQQPALVQVSLIHRGGIGSSAPSGHASAVTRALEGYVDIMLTSIREANK